MPNLKIFVDETLLPACRADLAAALPALRDLLCADLNVDVAACQFAVLSALVMADLPRVNVELHILPHPARTQDRLVALGRKVQSLIAAATRTHTAVRITTLAPEDYVVLK
jgi:hypothetical protein